MNFEDRLKHELQNQGAQIDIEPAGVDHIASRSAKRRQRRMAGMTAVVAMVLLGVGGFIATSNDAPIPVATDTEATDEQATDAEIPEQAADAELTDGEVVAGSPLDFVNIASGASPGGFGVYGTGVITSDAYYMLSTAPGRAAPNDYDAYLPNTLYKYDGSEWSNTSFGDRFISGLSVDEGVLYTVSTGTKTSDTPAIGRSNDGGQNWTWTDLDLTEQFGADPSAWPFHDIKIDTQNGTTFVVARAHAEVPWDEAIELAKNAGLDIDQETDGIVNISTEGISWIPDQYVLSPCAQLFDDEMSKRSAGFAEIEAELSRIYETINPVDETDGPFDELSAEQQARADELHAQLDALYEEAASEATAAVTAADGCQAYGECLSGQRALNERSEEFYETAGDDDYEAMETEYMTWLEESGCGPILGYDDGDFNDEDIESVTWAELGVTVPESWSGSTAGYLLTDDGVQNLGRFAVGEAGWLRKVTFDGTSFEVEFDGIWTEFNDDSQVPDVTVYSSTDGTAWTATTKPWGSTPQTFNGMSFSLDWDGDQNSILRNGPNGAERLSIESLAPGIDVSGFVAERVFVGNYGVVVVALEWEDVGEYGQANSIVLFSSDGMSFGTTPLDGMAVSSVMVGSDGVVVFANDMDLANSDTPQPVLFGTAS